MLIHQLPAGGRGATLTLGPSGLVRTTSPRSPLPRAVLPAVQPQAPVSYLLSGPGGFCPETGDWRRWTVVGRNRGEPEGRDAGTEGAARTGAPPLRSAHTRKQRESSGAGQAWESGTSRGGQVSAEGGWASQCRQEPRWILAQKHGRGAVVIRGCSGQVVVVAYWAVSVGGGREGYGP